MRIGVPTEVKNNESRVAVTPGGVIELRRRGHEVLLQQKGLYYAMWRQQVGERRMTPKSAPTFPDSVEEFPVEGTE